MTTEFTNYLDNLQVKYCFNEQQYDYTKLKYIIVGDNPGIKEFEEKQFFIGPSGRALRKHFFDTQLIEDFDQECIIFNKTFIHTKNTKELKISREHVGVDYFNAILIHCAKEIANISTKLELPILIFGKSHLGPNSLFEFFWKAITESTVNKEHLLVFSHPSYNNFFKEWTKNKRAVKLDSSQDLLNHIGLKNATDINNKYKQQLSFNKK